jgi:excisionase family DNA binding protein
MFDDMSPPAPGYLTVIEAAQRLSVVPNTIRALIAKGELSAAKVGDQWLIPVGAVDHRLSVGPRHGRRLTPAGAWGLLFLSDGKPAPWLTPVARWRMKQHLARHRLDDLRARLVDRGRSRALRAHPSMLARLREDPALMLTGATAASELHLGLIGGDHVEAYVDESKIDDVIRLYHLRPSREANLKLRVVPSFMDSWPPAKVAPISAIALDLLDDPDPRSQQVGEEMLRNFGP